MYPNNLILFLNQKHHSNSEQIFKKTINPMLDSVRMNPLLVTMSKEGEISSARWKNMELHDVVVECERFTLDKCRDEPATYYQSSRFTLISDRMNCFTPVNQSFPSSAAPVNGEQDSFWSPRKFVSPHSPLLIQAMQLESRSTAKREFNKEETKIADLS